MIVIEDGYECGQWYDGRTCREEIRFRDGQWEHVEPTSCPEPTPDCCLDGCALAISHNGPCAVST